MLVKPPELLPFGTKMSLSLVFAPAEVVEEMAEALPVCLWGVGQQSPPPPCFKKKKKKPNKQCLKTAAMPDKSTNEGQ